LYEVSCISDVAKCRIQETPRHDMRC